MFCCVSQYNHLITTKRQKGIFCASLIISNLATRWYIYELMKVYSENFTLMETKKVLTCLKYDQRQADIKGEWGWNQLRSLDIRAGPQTEKWENLNGTKFFCCL